MSFPRVATRSDPSVAATDDRAVIARIRAGDRAAFDALVAEFYRPLCAFLRPYVVTVDDAEEIVQDIFLNLWRVRERWTVQGTVRSYLFGAARNRGLNHVRDRKRAMAWSAEAVRDAVGESCETADAAVTRRELSQAIADAVSHLPERQRQTYALRWGHHLTVSEIASSMGVTTKCIEAHLTQATKTLRRLLAQFV